MKSDFLPTIEMLARRWPKCFSVYQGRRRPLKIGIYNDLLTALGDGISPQVLSLALRVYTVNHCYRGQLKLGAVRVDLNGDPAGVVTADQVPQIKKKPARAPKPVAPTMAELVERERNKPPPRPPQMSVQPPDMSRPFQKPHKPRGPARTPKFTVVKAPIVGTWRDRRGK